MLMINSIQHAQDFPLTNDKIPFRNQFEQEEKDLIEKLIELTLSPRLSKYDWILSGFNFIDIFILVLV